MSVLDQQVKRFFPTSSFHFLFHIIVEIEDWSAPPLTFYFVCGGSLFGLCGGWMIPRGQLMPTLSYWHGLSWKIKLAGCGRISLLGMSFTRGSYRPAIETISEKVLPRVKENLSWPCVRGAY